jgi:hypothetical protein
MRHARQASVPEKSADVVISKHCLEDTLSPLEELQRLHLVLRPGGMIDLYVPSTIGGRAISVGGSPTSTTTTYTHGLRCSSPL